MCGRGAVILKCDKTLNMTKKLKAMFRLAAECLSWSSSFVRDPQLPALCKDLARILAASICQVCDSDTRLDPMALLELVRVLDEDPRVGAVGGDVRILNPLDSWVSFLSSLRYWVAFNVERACQSYFHCVSCISGPLGEQR